MCVCGYITGAKPTMALPGSGLTFLSLFSIPPPLLPILSFLTFLLSLSLSLCVALSSWSHRHGNKHAVPGQEISGSLTVIPIQHHRVQSDTLLVLYVFVWVCEPVCMCAVEWDYTVIWQYGLSQQTHWPTGYYTICIFFSLILFIPPSLFTLCLLILFITFPQRLSSLLLCLSFTLIPPSPLIPSHLSSHLIFSFLSPFSSLHPSSIFLIALSFPPWSPYAASLILSSVCHSFLLSWLTFSHLPFIQNLLLNHSGIRE